MDMSLYDHLKSKRKLDSKARGLTEYKAKEYLYQLLRGLEHLHRHGLFHRDVKPENILIKFPSIEDSRLYKVKKYEIIKLADLGSVRGIYSMPPYTEYISTRWYRSPECLLTNGNYGPKMDVWAAGCVFYEMITLLPLFPGSNEIDQLSKVHQVIGSPTIQFLSKLKSKSRNCIVFPKTKGTGVDNLLPHITRQGRNTLELMIDYDPDKRINVRRLLKNSYFDDIRDKFEPVMEGNHQRYKHYLNKQPEYGKRTIGDGNSCSSSGKHKVIKREHYNDEKHKSPKGSAKTSSKGSIGSVKSRTPSIEIPYYARNPKQKISSLPLVDYKISKSYEEYSRVQSTESNKSNLSRKNSLKRNVEIILKSSRNSELNKTPSSKDKGESGRFHSRSLVHPKKNGYHKTDALSDNVKMPKSSSKYKKYP